MMDDVLVIDDIIDFETQVKIKDTMFSQDFPWFHFNDVVLGFGGKQIRRPAHFHLFYMNYKRNSNFCDMIEPIITNSGKQSNLNKFKMLKCRSFLQYPLNENYAGLSEPKDTPHIDNLDPHMVFLYYVCDSDGDTVIYNYDKKEEPDLNNLEVKKSIKPKQGRVVIFNGKYWHCSTQPKENIRCVINSNIICE